MSEPGAAGFWVRHALLPALGFLFLGVLIAAFGLDLATADFFYRPSSASFLVHDHRWIEPVLHRGGRWLVGSCAGAALAVFVASFVAARWRELRRPALFMFLSMALAPGVVALGKQVSGVDCPSGLLRYGGQHEYWTLTEHLLGRVPARPKPGRCFPAGHSCGGFSLMALYFLLRDRRPKLALPGLAAGVVLGTVFAVCQWARGAHFPSHDLWSAGIAWFCALGLYAHAFSGCVWERRATSRTPEPIAQVASGA